jgi:hypothetical protein
MITSCIASQNKVVGFHPNHLQLACPAIGAIVGSRGIHPLDLLLGGNMLSSSMNAAVDDICYSLGIKTLRKFNSC